MQKKSSNLRCKVLHGIEPLVNIANQWEKLWLQSSYSSPTYLVPHIQQYAEKFCLNQNIITLIVEDIEQNKLVAGLCLSETNKKHLGFKIAKLLNNEWSDCSQILLDNAYNPKDTLNPMIAAITEMKISVLEFNNIRVESPEWQVMCELTDEKFGYFRQTSEQSTGFIANSNWDEYSKTLSKNHRKNIKRRERRMEELGHVTLESFDTFTPDDVTKQLIRGFHIEAKSWKYRNQSATLQNDKISTYYIDQAKLFAHQGELRVFFLNINDESIAFEYGFFANGVYHSLRTGYDESYKEYSPGQLLFYKVMQSFSESNNNYNGTDFLGLTSSAMESWQPNFIKLANYTLATTKKASLTLNAFEHLKKIIHL